MTPHKSGKTIHAALVAIKGAGVLIIGPPGAGKSDLALRLIDGGARLVADDRVEPFVKSGTLCGRAPEKLAGLLEVRGAGIARLPFLRVAPVRLVVMLVAERKRIERLPDARPHHLAGFEAFGLPVLSLSAFDASAPARIRLALSQLLLPGKGKNMGRGPAGIWDFPSDAVMVRARTKAARRGKRADKKPA